MQQQLAAGLGEQIAEFVENDEVETSQIVSEPSLASGARFGFEPIDAIDGGEEAPPRAGTNTPAGDGDCEMRFARFGSTDKDDVALLGNEGAAGEIAHQSFIDRRIFEGEVVNILGERQLRRFLDAVERNVPDGQAGLPPPAKTR